MNGGALAAVAVYAATVDLCTKRLRARLMICLFCHWALYVLLALFMRYVETMSGCVEMVV